MINLRFDKNKLNWICDSIKLIVLWDKESFETFSQRSKYLYKVYYKNVL